MIKIPYIFKSASLGNLSSSAGGIKMTLRQYCEENVLDKEKKKEYDLNEHGVKYDYKSHKC